jgi:hypothetical protein
LGLRAIGIDINPVMVVVATARNAQSIDASTARAKLQHIRTKIKSTYEIPAEDGLSLWFAPETAKAFRQLSDAIQDDQSYATDYSTIFPHEHCSF